MTTQLGISRSARHQNGVAMIKGQSWQEQLEPPGCQTHQKSSIKWWKAMPTSRTFSRDQPHPGSTKSAASTTMKSSAVPASSMTLRTSHRTFTQPVEPSSIALSQQCPGMWWNDLHPPSQSTRQKTWRVEWPRYSSNSHTGHTVNSQTVSGAVMLALHMSGEAPRNLLGNTEHGAGCWLMLWLVQRIQLS